MAGVQQAVRLSCTAVFTANIVPYLYLLI